MLWLPLQNNNGNIFQNIYNLEYLYAGNDKEVTLEATQSTAWTLNNGTLSTSISYGNTVYTVTSSPNNTSPSSSKNSSTAENLALEIGIPSAIVSLLALGAGGYYYSKKGINASPFIEGENPLFDITSSIDIGSSYPLRGSYFEGNTLEGNNSPNILGSLEDIYPKVGSEFIGSLEGGNKITTPSLPEEINIPQISQKFQSAIEGENPLFAPYRKNVIPTLRGALETSNALFRPSKKNVLPTLEDIYTTAQSEGSLETINPLRTFSSDLQALKDAPVNVQEKIRLIKKVQPDTTSSQIIDILSLNTTDDQKVSLFLKQTGLGEDDLVNILENYPSENSAQIKTAAESLVGTDKAAFEANPVSYLLKLLGITSADL